MNYFYYYVVFLWYTIYYIVSYYILYYIILYIILYVFLGSSGGGQTISVSGAGMDDTVKVTVCGELCVNSNVTSTVVKCVTPPQGT